MVETMSRVALLAGLIDPGLYRRAFIEQSLNGEWF
jgi:hypothetical protein